MTLDTHIYFVPALHLHQSLIKSGSWVQMGECTLYVRPSVDKDLYTDNPNYSPTLIIPLLC